MSVKPENHTPSNPRGLGITCCTTCGQPVAVVGELSDTGDCRLCTHDLARYDVLADELVTHLRAWLEACRERRISDADIRTVLDIVVDTELDSRGVLA